MVAAGLPIQKTHTEIEMKKKANFIDLGNDYHVPENYLDWVRRKVEMNLCNLVYGRIYESKDLCGLEVWTALTRGQGIKVGHCIAYLVRNKKLPTLHLMNSDADGNKFYCLISEE
jgi:hypothetical protein